MLQECVNQSHDRHQQHSQEQCVRPAVVRIANCGSTGHDEKELNGDCQVSGAGAGQKRYSPVSSLTPTAYLRRLSRANATSVTQGMVTGRQNPHQEWRYQAESSGKSGSLKCLARGHGMMENTSSRFRVGAVTDLRVICSREGLDCSFGKPGLAEPFLSTRAAVHSFSILALWQECARQRGQFGVQVHPKLRLGPPEERSSEHSIELASCGQLRILKDLGMNGNCKAVTCCEAPL